MTGRGKIWDKLIGYCVVNTHGNLGNKQQPRKTLKPPGGKSPLTVTLRSGFFSGFAGSNSGVLLVSPDSDVMPHKPSSLDNTPPRRSTHRPPVPRQDSVSPVIFLRHAYSAPSGVTPKPESTWDTIARRRSIFVITLWPSAALGHTHIVLSAQHLQLQ